MRHKVAGRKFDRNSGARKALFRNLVTQLFKHDRIHTTLARAKETRSIAEKLITKAKREDLHSRRQVLRVVGDKEAVKRLFGTIVAKLSNHNSGGYTRITKIKNRHGDDAPMALLEILETAERQPKTKKGSKKKPSAKGKSKTKKVKEAPEKAKISKAKEGVPEAPPKDETLEMKEEIITPVKEETPVKPVADSEEANDSDESKAIKEEPSVKPAADSEEGEDLKETEGEDITSDDKNKED